MNENALDLSRLYIYRSESFARRIKGLPSVFVLLLGKETSVERLVPLAKGKGTEGPRDDAEWERTSANYKVIDSVSSPKIELIGFPVCPSKTLDLEVQCLPAARVASAAQRGFSRIVR